jgi:hypothetical protein
MANEDREGSIAIRKKERELEKAEQGAEAAQKILIDFLNKAKDAKHEKLAQEMLEGFRHGSRNEALERAKRGNGGQVFIDDEPLPTGLKEKWNEES